MSRTCCGVVDQVHQRRAQNKPQPWPIRKLAVGLTIAIVGDTCYVYAARFCRDMLTQSPNALGNRATGVAFLVVFALLLFLTSWSYFMVITTSPGDARLYTRRTTKPGNEPSPPSVAVHSHSPPGQPRADSHPPGTPIPMFSRRPTTTPVLLPEYRYCSKCQIVKPPRAHHCRACGTCVLKYDHHCPWIGQCVGAFNQKFFVNFLQWATVLAFWTFGTLLGLNVKPHARPIALDPQQIVTIALAGFFGLFCCLILAVQVHLILLNQTTVESLTMRTMRDREQELISHMHKWYDVCAKWRTRRDWDNEWGRIGIEGNLWWLGSRKENWTAVMSANKWRWFLPVAGTPGDGLKYPVNPRFDSAGRWMRRKEWPSDLQ